MNRIIFVMAVISGFALSSSGQTLSHQPSNPHPVAISISSTASAHSATASSTSTYALVAWTELGMHCIDGKDYSIFSVLPPYNVIHAQLVEKTEPPVLINGGVTITYQAMADAKGSINSSSASKNACETNGS